MLLNLILSLSVLNFTFAADVEPAKEPGTFYVPANYDELPQIEAVKTKEAKIKEAQEAAQEASRETASDDEAAKTEEAEAEEVPDSEVAQDTPVVLEEIAGERSLTASRPWRAPEYLTQTNALGYSDKAFAVHPALERNVKFWIDIYSKYTTDQGVIHDAENIDLVYEVIDFTALASRGDINIFRKEAIKLKAVKDRKKYWINVLKKLNKQKDETNLNPDELRIWNVYKNDTNKKKFVDATGKNRLRFQLGQKDRVIQGIYFSGRYIEDFEKIFRDNGLPMELSRLPFVESSYNVLARSRVGASGLWQIMPGTGRPFVMMNDAVDKRNHPIEATKLAAKVLKKNYELLGSWDLALTGYNHGPYGMLKLKKKTKLDTLGDMIASNANRKTFGFASKNFYASFLAILEVERNAPKYLGTVLWSMPLDMKEFKVPNKIKYSQVLKWFDGDDKKAQIYNPQINSAARKKNIFIPKNAIVGVPKSKFEEVKAELKIPDEMVLEDRLSTTAKPE